MATTILQSWVGRCRQDFTTTSNTAVLISGTQRKLTGLTAGSYLDISAEVSFANGDAGDATFQVFLATQNGSAAAIAEGAGQSVVTAADFGSASIRTLYGPITSAQASAGLVIDLRAATSADTLSITAATTPTKYGAVLRVDEVSLGSAVGLPTNFPNLLCWLKADSGVTYDKTTKRVSAWTDNSGSRTLAYSGQTGNFTAGLVLTGGTSGATATIHSDTDGGATGTLVLTNVTGTFTAGETITDSSTGSATVASAPAALAIVGGSTAPLYESSVVNSLPGLYFPGTDASTMTFSDLPGQPTAIYVFAVVSVSASLRAGASLLNPPTASAAACLRVTLSNSSVNRNALLRTSGPEYVSTTTTVTSGKALMMWRYNKGTTTGAARVNGQAEVTDTSFDETLTNWAMIGSTDNATYALGDFRLCELIIYGAKQASTEDVLASSDVLAIRDYLNGKWSIF